MVETQCPARCQTTAEGHPISPEDVNMDGNAAHLGQVPQEGQSG